MTRFAFPVNNAYTIAPPVDIALIEPLTPHLDINSETLFALPGANPAQPVPVVGARGEALFDAVPLARASRTIVVRLGDRKVARRADRLQPDRVAPFAFCPSAFCFAFCLAPSSLLTSDPDPWQV